MKKIYSIFASMLLFVGSANAQTVLINEDFSGLTDGTEDSPSTTTLVDDMGDFINPSALKPYSDALSYKKWGGIGLYSAGGCIAIKDGWFLNTPAGDMSGNVSISFRARLLDKEENGRNALDLIFLSRKGLIDFGRKTYNLTSDWQTFKYSSDKGNFETTGFQFFSNTEATILIDDIRVEKEQKSISAPVAQEAENITDHSFKAVWTATPEAEHYLLSVYSKVTSDEIKPVEEGFENIKANEDGSFDATTSNLPDGWKFASSAEEGKGCIATTGGADGSKQALRMSADGDAFTTPICKEGVKSFSMWVKAEKHQESVPYGSYIQISLDTDFGLYPWQYIDIPDLLTDEASAGQVFDFTNGLSAFEKVYAVKVEYVPILGDETTVLFDNVKFSYPTPPTLTYALEDKVVEVPTSAGEDVQDVSYNVTGLSPDFDYFYSVKAENSKFVSEPSNEVEVYAVSQPKALEPTDITMDGYTANWACNNKVDVFRVEQVQINDITEDTDDYTMLYEDFSKVKSDLTEEDLEDGQVEYGEYTSTYLPIDDLTHIAGWKASSTQRINGWLGGMPSSGATGEIAGAIVTPTIDLSHNDGECNVTIRAYGNVDDWLVIQGVNPAAYAGIRFPEGGFVETTVTIPTCTAKEQFTFYSNNYYPFLIDYIKITQNVKAGEKVAVITGATVTEDATTRSVVMKNPNFGPDHDVYYKVTALRYYHGDKKDAVASTPSELMRVKAPAAGIAADKVSTQHIGTFNGGISLTNEKPMTMRVYTTSGQLVASRMCNVGTTRVQLSAGVYIVKAGDKVSQVVVK